MPSVTSMPFISRTIARLKLPVSRNRSKLSRNLRPLTVSVKTPLLCIRFIADLQIDPHRVNAVADLEPVGVEIVRLRRIEFGIASTFDVLNRPPDLAAVADGAVNAVSRMVREEERAVLRHIIVILAAAAVHRKTRRPDHLLPLQQMAVFRRRQLPDHAVQQLRRQQPVRFGVLVPPDGALRFPEFLPGPVGCEPGLPQKLQGPVELLQALCGRLPPALRNLRAFNLRSNFARSEKAAQFVRLQRQRQFAVGRNRQRFSGRKIRDNGVRRARKRNRAGVPEQTRRIEIGAVLRLEIADGHRVVRSFGERERLGRQRRVGPGELARFGVTPPGPDRLRADENPGGVGRRDVEHQLLQEEPPVRLDVRILEVSLEHIRLQRIVEGLEVLQIAVGHAGRTERLHALEVVKLLVDGRLRLAPMLRPAIVGRKTHGREPEARDFRRGVEIERIVFIIPFRRVDAVAALERIAAAQRFAADRQDRRQHRIRSLYRRRDFGQEGGDRNFSHSSR